MPEKNYRGITVPEAGDDLLSGLTTMAATTLSYTRTQNSESANLLAAQAIAGGANVSKANPMLFLTNSWNQYAHDGTTLRSLNKPTYKELLFAGSGEWKRGKKGKHTLASLGMRAVPYDRIMLIFGMVSINLGKGSSSQPGWAYLHTSAMGGGSNARHRLDEGDHQGASTFDMKTIPADTNPDIKIGIDIRADPMDYYLTTSRTSNRLMAIGFPINMSGQ